MLPVSLSFLYLLHRLGYSRSLPASQFLSAIAIFSWLSTWNQNVCPNVQAVDMSTPNILGALQAFKITKLTLANAFSNRNSNNNVFKVPISKKFKDTVHNLNEVRCAKRKKNS